MKPIVKFFSGAVLITFLISNFIGPQKAVADMGRPICTWCSMEWNWCPSQHTYLLRCDYNGDYCPIDLQGVCD